MLLKHSNFIFIQYALEFIVTFIHQGIVLRVLMELIISFRAFHAYMHSIITDTTIQRETCLVRPVHAEDTDTFIITGNEMSNFKCRT